MAERGIVLRNAWVDADRGLCTVMVDHQECQVNFFGQTRRPLLSLPLLAWLQIAQTVNIAMRHPSHPVSRFEVKRAFPRLPSHADARCIIHVWPAEQLITLESDLQRVPDPILRFTFEDAQAINTLWPQRPISEEDLEESPAAARPAAQHIAIVITPERRSALRVILNKTPRDAATNQERAVVRGMVDEIERALV